MGTREKMGNIKFGFSNVPIYDVTIDGWKEQIVKTRKKKDEEQKKGRPTKKSEEERRKRLSEEEQKKEDLGREKRRMQRKLREAKKKRLTLEERKRKEEVNARRREARKEKRRKEEEERRSKLTEEERQLEDEMGMETYTVEESKYKIVVERYWYKQAETLLVPYKAASKVYKKSKSHPDTKQPPCDDDKIFIYPSLFLPDTKNIKWRFREKQDNRRFGRKKIDYTVVPFQNTMRNVFSMSTKVRKILSLPEETNDCDDLEERIEREKLEYVKTLRSLRPEEKQLAQQDRLELKTIDLYNKREELIKGIFKGEDDPEKMDILKERRIIDIVGFKIMYSNDVMYIACKYRGEYEVIEVEGVLKFLLNEYALVKAEREPFIMLPKAEHQYSLCTICFLLNHILRYNGTSLNFINEVIERDPHSIKYDRELKKYYDEWLELERKKEKEVPKMKLLETTTVKPTLVADLESDEYEAYKYMLRTFRGKEQIILYVQNDKQKELPVLGSWLTEELKKMDLTNTIAPIRVRFGERIAMKNANRPDRRTTIMHLVD